MKQVSKLRRAPLYFFKKLIIFPKFSLIFPSLFVSFLMAPMMSAALIHIFSYLYAVPINFFSSFVFIVASTGITFRIIVNYQIKHPSRINLRNQYGTLLGLSIGLLPILSALQLANSTIWSQRFNWLYFSNEDNAAWVSLARATLQNGHLPQGTIDSEYSLYGSASVLPGVIIRILTSGKTASSHYEAALMGIDAVLLSYLYAAVVTVALVAAFLLILPTNLDLPKKENFFSPMILAASIGLASASLFVAIPIAQGSFLGISWAIIGSFTAMLFSYWEYETKRLSIGILLYIILAANFSVSIWPYLQVVYISVSLVTIVLTSRDARFSRYFKIFVPAALVLGGSLGAIEPFLSITQNSTFATLSSAQGLIIERNQILIFLAISSAIYILFLLKDRHDINPAIPAFVVGSIVAAGIVTFITRQNGLLGEYGIAKLQYIGISIAIISGLLYFAIQISSFENAPISILLAMSIFSAVNYLPQLSAISTWPSSFSTGGIGPPGDALKYQLRKMSKPNFSCIPKNDDSREKAYVCNRWASALSSTNSDLDFQFRAALLNDPRDVKVIVDEFRAKNFFDDRIAIPISEILALDTK